MPTKEQRYRTRKYDAILREPNVPQGKDTWKTIYNHVEPGTPETAIGDDLALYTHHKEPKYLVHAMASLLALYKSHKRTSRGLFFELLEELERRKMSS